MFLESTPKQQTASQISAWLANCKSSMESAKISFEQIKSWIVVSMENPEYTDEDRGEIIIKLEELRTLAISLTK